MRRGALHEPGNAGALLGGDQRTHLDAGLRLRAHLESADGAGQVRDDLLVHCCADIEPAGGRAVLPGIVEAEGADAADDCFQIRVVEHDDRRLASELQMSALQIAGRSAQHLLSGRHIAREGRHANARVSDQRCTDALAAPADDVDDALREQFAKIFRQLQRREGRLLRGLEDHSVASGKGRCQLPRRHHQRIVPRCDRGDHAHRIAADHAGESGQKLPAERSVLGPRGAGEESKHIRDGGDLIVLHRRDRLAGVARLELGKRRSVALDVIGQLEQQGGTVLRCGPRPGVEGAFGRRHGGIHLSATGFGHLHDRFAGRRIEHTLGPAFALH